MNSILKKTLIAAAVAGVASVNAATITTNGFTSAYLTKADGSPQDWPLISSEGLGIAGSVDVGSGAGEIDVLVTLGAAYVAGDFLTLTFNGASVNGAGSAGASLAAVSSSGAFSLSNVTDTSIQFRVTADASIGDTFTLEGVTLTGATGAISISSAGSAAGTAFDEDPAVPVAAVASEFSARIGTDSLDQTIDVEKSRKQFVNGATTDEVDVTIGYGADLLGVTTAGSSIVLKGSDLEFLRDADGDLDSGSYALAGAAVNANGTSLNDTNTELTVATSDGPAAGTDSLTLTLTADGVTATDGSVLSDQEFSLDLNLGYYFGAPGSADSISFTGLDAGEWDLSGATVQIEFMPYGSGITQFIYITNNSSVSGDIEVSAIGSTGEVYGPVSLNDVTAVGNAVTNITRAVNEALDSAGANTSSGRLAITLVVNAPAANVDVTAGYNSRGDRVLVK